LNIFIGSIKWRKRQGKYVAASSVLVLALLGGLALFSFQAFAITAGMKATPNPVDTYYSLRMGANMAFMITILSTVMRSMTPSKMNDTDLLLAMPIKKSDVVISKSFSKYFFDLLPIALIIVPYVVSYGILIRFEPGMILGTMIVVLMLPLFSVGLSYLFSSFINYFGGQFRYGNFVKIVLTLILVFGFIFLSSANPTMSNNPMKYILPSNWMVDIIISLKSSSLAYFGALTVIPFLLGVILFSISFGTNRVKYVSANKKLNFQSHTLFHSLLKKEARRYFSSPIYVINTIIGPIFIIGVAVYTLFGGAQLKAILATLPSEIIPYLVSGALATTVGMSSTSASSISLEGKNIWILKAHPVNPKAVFLAKAGFNMLLTLPVSLLAVIITSFTLSLGILDSLLLIAFAFMICTYVGLVGVLFNMWFPKMEWDSDTVVVKQSLSVLLAMLAGMFLSIILFVPGLIFGTQIPFYLYQLILIVFYGLINAGIWKLLSGRGVKAFNEL
jgi:ABC-2 type transport system permease protein